jgi:hypothetical protein
VRRCEAIVGGRPFSGALIWIKKCRWPARAGVDFPRQIIDN